jgi:hypothetical protein
MLVSIIVFSLITLERIFWTYLSEFKYALIFEVILLCLTITCSIFLIRIVFDKNKQGPAKSLESSPAALVARNKSPTEVDMSNLAIHFIAGIIEGYKFP